MTTTFAFDDVPVVMPNGETWLAAGEVDLEADIQPAEPDVGIFSAYPADFGFSAPFVVELWRDGADESRISRVQVLTWCDPIWLQIAEARKDRIEQELMDDYNTGEDW